MTTFIAPTTADTFTARHIVIDGRACVQWGYRDVNGLSYSGRAPDMEHARKRAEKWGLNQKSRFE